MTVSPLVTRFKYNCYDFVCAHTVKAQNNCVLSSGAKEKLPALFIASLRPTTCLCDYKSAKSFNAAIMQLNLSLKYKNINIIYFLHF